MLIVTLRTITLYRFAIYNKENIEFSFQVFTRSHESKFYTCQHHTQCTHQCDKNAHPHKGYNPRDKKMKHNRVQKPKELHKSTYIVEVQGLFLLLEGSGAPIKGNNKFEIYIETQQKETTT